MTISLCLEETPTPLFFSSFLFVEVRDRKYMFMFCYCALEGKVSVKAFLYSVFLYFVEMKLFDLVFVTWLCLCRWS